MDFPTPREAARRAVGRLQGEEEAVATEDRGFASMDSEKQRAIARKGGRAAHEKGTAHEWTTDEARTAGRKGGIVSHQRRRERKAQDAPDAPE